MATTDKLTDCLVMMAAHGVHHPDYRAMIIGSSWGNLLQIINRAEMWYPKIDARVQVTDIGHRWVFSSGAIIRLGHAHKKEDMYRYGGTEAHFVGFDEGDGFLNDQIKFLSCRARSAISELPAEVWVATSRGLVRHTP